MNSNFYIGLVGALITLVVLIKNIKELYIYKKGVIRLATVIEISKYDDDVESQFKYLITYIFLWNDINYSIIEKVTNGDYKIGQNIDIIINTMMPDKSFIKNGKKSDLLYTSVMFLIFFIVSLISIFRNI